MIFAAGDGLALMADGAAAFSADLTGVSALAATAMRLTFGDEADGFGSDGLAEADGADV